MIAPHEYRAFMNQKLCNNKVEYDRYCEFARLLNIGEIKPFEQDAFLKACFYQSIVPYNEYNHLDAFFLSQMLNDYYNGNILFAVLQTHGEPEMSKDLLFTNQIVCTALPCRGDIEELDASYEGSNGVSDGYFGFKGDVEFWSQKLNGNELVKDVHRVQQFNGLLQVGFTDLATTYCHLYVNKGNLVRFPYHFELAGLLMLKDLNSNTNQYGQVA